MQLLPLQVDSFTTELRRGSFESHKWLYVKMKVTTSIYLPLPCIMEKAMATHSSTGKSHGRRSLVGYSPWGREESVD